MTTLVEFSLRHIFLVSISLILISILITFECYYYLFASQALSPTLTSVYINRQQASVLDLRNRADFLSEHLINSKNVTYQQLPDILQSISITLPIILVTESDIPPFKVLHLLRRQGYTHLYHLKDGIAAWKASNLPLVASPN